MGRLSWQVYRGFSQSLQRNTGILKRGHDHFIPHHFKYLVSNRSAIRRCMIGALQTPSRISEASKVKEVVEVWHGRYPVEDC
jgi:hypothetical protein